MVAASLQLLHMRRTDLTVWHTCRFLETHPYSLHLALVVLQLNDVVQ